MEFEMQQQQQPLVERVIELAPPIKVCTECRKIKSKCVHNANSDPPERCQRCTRLNLSCIIRPHQRGRRPKAGNESSTPPPAKKQRTANSPLASPQSYGHHSHQQVSSVRASLFQSPGGSQDHESVIEEDAHAHIDTANSVYHAVADRSTFSIAGVMDRQGDAPENGESSTPTYTDDPVSRNVLSMEESESLFDHYHDQLQTCVCLLDKRVHTPQYVRQRSPQLFATVLASASKFFRPDLYEPLLAIADLLVERAIYGGVTTLEVVQAICLLHSWKKPTDSRGWFRIGHAIRAAYQLDLHLMRRPLPEDEFPARLQLDKERTWISLYCFDSTMTLLSDRPSMMHQAPDVDRWLRTSPYPLPSDGQLEFAVKTSLLTQEIRQLQACRGSYEVMRSGLRRIQEDLQRSYQALNSDNAQIHLTPTSNSIVKFSALGLQLLAECTSFSISPVQRKAAVAHTCVSTSLEMLQIVIDDFARRGVMPMIEDAHSVAVASTAVRLVRFLPFLDPSARSAVRRKLTKVVIVCREAARGDHGSHPAYLARFVHTLVDKAQLSRRPSPVQSPQNLPADSALAPLGVTSTSPDEWWDRVGHLVYQDPVPSFDDQQGFWDGFPILAGVMNAPPVETLSTLPADGIQGDPWLFDLMGFSGNA